jgi:hypothetical protein
MDAQAADVAEASAPIPELPGLFLLGASSPTPTRGTVQGTPVPSMCPGEQVLIGYQGTLANPGILLVSSLQLRCGKVDVAGPSQLSISPGTTLPVQGTVGMSPFSAQCPAGHAIVGIHGQSGLYMDQIGFDCAPLTRLPNGTVSVGTSTALTAYGGNGGSPFNDPCPSGQVVRGCDISTSGFLYSIDAQCAAPSAPSCVADLSNISTGSFHVSFTVRTTLAGSVALINQRNVCGVAPYWDIRLSNGNVSAETDDGGDGGTRNSVTTSGALVNDGQPHAILVERVNGTLAVFIDGVKAGSTMSVSNFGALPPLEVGKDPCDNVDGTVALVGSVTNVCLTAL